MRTVYRIRLTDIYKTMNKEEIEKSLLKGFENGSGDEQEQACLLAIKRIGDNENEAGMFSNFMIELRDFLLDYCNR
jgi:hypothetical protein